MSRSIIKGICVKIEGDSSGLAKAITKVDKSLSETQKKLAAVDKALKLDPNNMELIAAKTRLTQAAISELEQKLGLLRAAWDEMLKAGEKCDDIDMANLAAEIALTDNKLKELKGEFDDTGDKGEESGNKIKLTWADINGALQVAKTGYEAIKRAAEEVVSVMVDMEKAALNVSETVASGLVDVVKSSVDEFANYQQRWFAMEQLFGDDVGIAQENANQAWLTMGLSISDYYETSANFMGAVLKNTEDTAQAADLVDRALQAMADDSAFFGNSMENNLTVLRALARNNFAMLDNLQLGMAGSQRGMIELINITGVAGRQIESLDEEGVNFMTYLEAIVAYEEQLGVWGATEAQAATTVNGAINMLKASWANLMLALAQGEEETDEAVGNMVQAVEIAVDNFAPLIQTIIADINEAMPQISEAISGIISSSDFQGVITSLAGTLASFAPIFVDSALDIVDAVFVALGNKDLSSSVANMVSSFVLIGNQLIVGILQGATQNLGNILPLVEQILTTLAGGLTVYYTEIGNFIILLTDYMAQAARQYGTLLVVMALEIIVAIVNALIENIDVLLPAIVEMVVAVVDTILANVDLIIDAALACVEQAIIAVIGRIPDIVNAAARAVASVAEYVTSDGITFCVQAVMTLLESLLETLTNAIPNFVNFVSTIFTSCSEEWNSFLPNVATWGADLISAFVGGIRDNISSVRSAVTDVASTVASYLHFTCPDVGPLANNLIDKSGADMIEAFVGGMALEMPTLESGLNTTAQIIADGMTSNQPNYSGYLEDINRSIGNQNFAPVINVNVGNERLDSYIAGANNRNMVIGGGY